MKTESVGQTRPVQPVEPARGESRKKSGDYYAGPVKVHEREDEQKKPQNDERATEKAVDLLNRTMESYNTELRFTMHKESGEYLVRIINTRDNTVIREIPPERVLEMVAYFKEMLGLVVDKFI